MAFRANHGAKVVKKSHICKDLAQNCEVFLIFANFSCVFQKFFVTLPAKIE